MQSKGHSRASPKNIGTVESLLKTVHSSGYYVSALERLRREKKLKGSRETHGSKFEGYDMPPEPPLISHRFEGLNLNEITKFKQPSIKSDVSSGPQRPTSGQEKDSNSPAPIITRKPTLQKPTQDLNIADHK